MCAKLAMSKKDEYFLISCPYCGNPLMKVKRIDETIIICSRCKKAIRLPEDIIRK